jgi:hypothetical protein
LWKTHGYSSRTYAIKKSVVDLAASIPAFAAVAVSGFAPASRRACLPIARAFAS